MFESDNDPNDDTLVVPGDALGPDTQRPGMGTYQRNGSIFSANVGTVNLRAGYINVQAFKGRYMPRQGDSVVGIIIDSGPQSWFVDINSAYNSLLHGAETQWKVDFGTAGQFLNVGDVVLAKIKSVDEVYRVNLTMKEHGLRKLTRGQVLKLSHTRVPLLIGRGGSMISLLKDGTDCRIFIGQNGVIWVDGSLEGISRAVDAIDLIDRLGPVADLMSRVEEHMGVYGNRNAGDYQIY